MRAGSLIRSCFRAVALLVLVAAITGQALGLDPSKRVRQYGHRSWSTDSGLPQNTVHAITQSSDGYLWIGTESGLVRFDGVEFVVYDKGAPGYLPSASITSLFAERGSDGVDTLWIGTEDGLVRHREAAFTTFGTAEGLPANLIWSISADTQGGLLVVTSEGIARSQGDRFLPIPIPSGISGPESVVEAGDGSLWIGTRIGLEHLQRGASSASPLLSDHAVEQLAITPDGRIWAGTSVGLFWSGAKQPAALELVSSLASSNEITALTAGDDGSLWVGTAKGAAVIEAGLPSSAQWVAGLPRERVRSIFQDREGAIWIAFEKSISRVYQGHADSTPMQDGLGGNAVLAMYEDREGSLWLGTESDGIEMLHDQKFTSYTAAAGLSNDLVRSVLQDKEQRIWLGTNGGGVDRFQNGSFTSLTTAEHLSSNIVLALGAAANGDLWAGTPDGLNHLRGDRLENVFTSADGLADDFVRSLYPASDGSLWIGTRRGLSHLDKGHYLNYSKLDGLGSDLVGAIAEGSDHSLWIGTLGGLSHWKDQRFTTLTTRDGLSSNVITALFEDQGGTLWIGTNQGGLNRLRDGRTTAYPPEHTHLPESIYAILQDNSGNLWLSSKTGIYRVARHELDEFAKDRSTKISPTAFGTADGMKISECSSGGHPAAWKLASGEMWFATLKGAVSIDPDHLKRNLVVPPVAVTQMFVDDKPVKTTSLTIAPGGSRFEFHYAGLSFVAPQKVRYRYKLDGFDREWVDAGARRTAYYTNLSPGSYRFRVLACNNDGIWNNTGAIVDFRLRPHFYQTWWFYLLPIAMAVFSVFQVYLWRLRQAELRFDAVLSERGRIAREIHDTLAQSLVGISVQLELVHRLLASSVEGARSQLDQARTLVRESLSEARTSIWDLRSQTAETEDLATRIARIAQVATDRSGSKIKLQTKIGGTYRPLASRIEAELLRIAQEAVHNAVRHADPKHIFIEVRFASQELLMTIEDDGCGFDGLPHPHSSGPGGHFGLTGMKERAREIGGTLLIDSRPGRGTIVSLRLTIDGHSLG